MPPLTLYVDGGGIVSAGRAQAPRLPEPSSSWGTSLAPAHGHLRRRLVLTPLSPPLEAGGRGSPCRGCVELGDDGDRRRVGVSSGTHTRPVLGRLSGLWGPGKRMKRCFLLQTLLMPLLHICSRLLFPSR